LQGINEKQKDMKVLILCGGKGERLKPLTESLPKPLVRIKGRPILSYLLSHFESYGFHKFVVAVGYKSEAIVRYFRQNHRNLQVEIVDSGEADIIKRIRDSAEYLKEDFIMGYGDTLADVDLDRLIRFHQSHEGDVSITCYPLRTQFGVVEMDGSGREASFLEKPVLDKWINIGYYYFDKRIMALANRHNKFLDFLYEIIEEGGLYGYKHKGVHITVNTIKELQDAETNITQLEEKIGSLKNV